MPKGRTCLRDKIQQQLFQAVFSNKMIREMYVSAIATKENWYYTPRRECMGQCVPDCLADNLEVYLNGRAGRSFFNHHPRLLENDLLFPNPFGQMLSLRRIQGIRRDTNNQTESVTEGINMDCQQSSLKSTRGIPQEEVASSDASATSPNRWQRGSV